MSDRELHERRVLAERVKSIRVAAGLTQRAASETSGVDPMSISRWERGASQPTLIQLNRYAVALGANGNALIGPIPAAEPVRKKRGRAAG